MNFKFDDLVNAVDVHSIKSFVTKVTNAVNNYTEYEVKVREATNDEPWGASSTLMRDIANATHHYEHYTYIMETMFKRMSDQTPENWRQVYKALQLLEFLIKNGSERVVDTAQSQLYILRSLRNFHYIDEKGKDQGINVRNRSSEIVTLLGSTDMIRDERKKAKQNRDKYQGV
ncbi:hypothetical protein CXG81DRAFT_13176, partial [Caulochytrium protostelioides]